MGPVQRSAQVTNRVQVEHKIHTYMRVLKEGVLISLADLLDLSIHDSKMQPVSQLPLHAQHISR